MTDRTPADARPPDTLPVARRSDESNDSSARERPLHRYPPHATYNRPRSRPLVYRRPRSATFSAPRFARTVKHARGTLGTGSMQGRRWAMSRAPHHAHALRAPHPAHACKQCLNCGDVGHLYRDCPHPHTSFGVMLFREVAVTNSEADAGAANVKEEGVEEAEDEVKTAAAKPATPSSPIRPRHLIQPIIEYLLICRRHSFGYTECVRARFDLTDRRYLRQLLCEMTGEERYKVATWNFSALWMDLWQKSDKPSRRDQYHNEYMRAHHQFQSLRESSLFQELLRVLPPSPWTTPEWGFPKGKRNKFESGQECAQRELAEETGICTSFAYNILGKRSGFTAPCVETFQGTDGQRYRHIYYVAEFLSHTEDATAIDPGNHLQTREVSAVAWCTYDECLRRIRSYNVAKQLALQRTHRRVCAYVRDRPRSAPKSNAATTTPRTDARES